MMTEQKNWAGNLTYSAQRWHKPESLDELQRIVRQAEKVKAVGTRHCFNTIADTPQDMIDLTGWDRVLELDPVHKTVTVEAGVRYGELAVYLNEAGYALHNLASLPHISVVGAVATATHGSGIRNRNLSSAVTALEIVTANGDLLHFDPDHRTGRFAAAVVNLGALGVVTKVTLKIEPTYNMRQNIYVDLPFSALEAHFDAIMSSGYSVSIFTDWRTDNLNNVWIKQRVSSENDRFDAPESFYGAVPATEMVHPIPGVSTINCTDQLGVVGTWYNRLPHFRLEYEPGHGQEVQTEYFVARDKAITALQAVNAIRDQIAAQLLTSEIRTVKADHLWMSPAYQQDCVALHFTWKLDMDATMRCVALLEDQLMSFNIRPHWGKVFSLSGSYLREQFPRWYDFAGFMRDIDPQGKFRNPFIEQVFFG